MVGGCFSVRLASRVWSHSSCSVHNDTIRFPSPGNTCGRLRPCPPQFPEFQTRYHCPRSMAAAERYAALAKATGVSLAALALAWCASRWYVASTIIGATTLAQLKENINAFEMVTLDEATLQAIDAIHLDIRNPNVTD